MTTDTITPERIDTLAALLDTAARRVADIWQEAMYSDTSPAEAAAEINEIMSNLNAANQ